MTTADTAELDRLGALFRAQKDAAAREPRRPVADRRADLRALQRAVVAASPALAAAVAEDFGTRAATETELTETFYVVEAAKHARRNVAAWARPRPVRLQALLQPGRSFIEQVPKGVVGIVSPWNYPIQLALIPLIDALAAGCRALLKPSETTPRTTAALEALLAGIFPEDQVAVISGDGAIGAAFAALPFDHLLFTGSAATARKVAAAAAPNLTPLTLELGGKSPAIVTEGFGAERAARSLAWAKFLNAGQTCICADYVLAPAGEVRALGEAIIARLRVLYPEGSAGADYTSIITDAAYDRLEDMVREAAAGGALVLRAESDAPPRATRKFPPTVVLNPPSDCALMREEIFGPVLPIVGVASLDDAIARVNARERPLALYVYTADRRVAREVLSRTVSGGAGVNHEFLHMTVRDAPFGGIGASGMGAYHGKAGFLTFTHQRTVFRGRTWHPAELLAPPYGRMHRRFLKWRLRG